MVKDILLNIFLFLLYRDISVDCGTEYINLAIKFCPVVYTGYNESELILNNIMNNPECHATLDTTVLPPVARFSFPINSTNACGSNFVVSNRTGVFSDFSNIETVNISGIIRSKDITTGTVTYNAELKYYYSCAYPLEYLINNTRMDVSGSSIAVKDNNGSLISTLNLRLFSDINYTQPLVMPPLGLELRTNVFVQVEATNLTSQYFLLLDRCFASISTIPTTRKKIICYLMICLISCSGDRLTKMLVNGEMQTARFSFPAFRFTEQQNQTVSTYYLHCITRLCEISTCSAFRQCGKRKRRDVVPLTTTPSPNGVTETRTITSPAIIIRADNGTFLLLCKKQNELLIFQM
uniref:Si:ch211-103f14.3 n=1 Tax=Cyprinus carpio TaxID=7962 RepID=A0A8C1G4Q0_CYPCA